MSPHLEPVRGMLSRVLRQRVLQVETRSRLHDGDAMLVVEFLVRLHSSLNRLCPEGVFIPPSVFTSCPVNTSANTDRWFATVWNESVVPKVVSGVRDHLARHPEAAASGDEWWRDPLELVDEAGWPWQSESEARAALTTVKAEEVGLKAALNGQKTQDRPTSGKDPLYNMLMHLQDVTTCSDQ